MTVFPMEQTGEELRPGGVSWYLGRRSTIPGQLLLPLFFWEVLNQGMLTSNVLWHGYYNQAQGLCRKISTYNYKGSSANLQVLCFIFNHCSETQCCGIWCLWIRAHVSRLPSENLAVVILLLPVWLGEGLGQALCTQAWRRQWPEESVNHAGLT